MKSSKVYILGSAILFLGWFPALAQFDSGSDGSDGELVVPSVERVFLDIPDDGVFNFTTVTINGELRFNRNARTNAPPILLAQGDIVIRGVVRVNGANATAFVGGAGGPGGFDGGHPGITGIAPGAGHGPGAGAAGIDALPGGNAAYGGPAFSDLATDGVVYGSLLLVPLVGGSGGGGDDDRGGGGGAGAILFSSSTQVVHNGLIQAIGGASVSGRSNGSGGAIRIVTPFLSGSGSFNVIGGAGGWGGRGRIRLDLIDRTGLSANLTPTGTSVGSFMAVFPSVVPRLDIVHVAGTDIPLGTPSPIVVTLPFGSPASQEVRVKASGFPGPEPVPISIVLTPDSGDRTVVDTEIDPDGEVSITADFPQNIATRVHAWTR